MRRCRIFSRVLPRQLSRDIGRKSVVEEGLGFFGSGMTSAVHHLRGTWPDWSDRLKSLRSAECSMGGRFERIWYEIASDPGVDFLFRLERA